LDPTSAIHTALLLHDGELSDLRSLLDRIGVASLDGLDGVANPDAEYNWDLVIATPTKLVDLPAHLGERHIVCIAESNSRTLRKMLERANVGSVIVRPVHPAALKQVLEQALYSRAENRRSLRRAAGHSVRFRSGGRAENAVLVDLSMTGCQLLAPRSLAAGCNLTVYVPMGANSMSMLSLRGTVVRTSLHDGPEAERRGIHVQFGELSDKIAHALAEIVEGLADGPAMLPSEKGASKERRASIVAAPSDGSSKESSDSNFDCASDRAPDCGGDSDGGKELRIDPRLVYSARIIVLGEGSVQVLTAEDISSGGLRAASHPDLTVGDELQVAIPLPGEKMPLVARARVMRNQDGLGFAFDHLPAEAHGRLHRALRLLPEAESSFTEEAEPAPVILSDVHDEKESVVPDEVIVCDMHEDDDPSDLTEVIVSEIR
jgi:hypothetical protein